MEIRVMEAGNIKILDFAGKLDTGTSPEAETAISKVLESGCNKLIINLKGIEYVSSSGLRVFLITVKKLAALNGQLKICQPSEVVSEILDISGFSTILDVRDSEEEALSAMQL